MVDILMAVYNGENFIAQQIESILSQTYDNWQLIIQDDLSTDKTLEIIEKYIEKFPDKITLFKNKVNSGSAGANFFELLNKSKSEYVMFCDQDDVWKEDKIEVSLSKMQELEKSNISTPILVHTDLEVINKDKKLIAKSMFKLQHLDSSRTRLNQLLVQNIITGCTVMINRALINKLGVLPRKIVMHDWWLGIMASLFGVIGFVDKPTLLYRQHGNNTVGAKDMGSARYIAKRAKNSKNARHMLGLGYMQAEEIAKDYRKVLEVQNAEQYKMIFAYGQMSRLNKVEKLCVVVRYRIWKSGVVRKLGQLWYM